MRVVLHGAEGIAKARQAGQMAAQVLAMIKEYVVPGVTTEELDRICHEYIVHELKVVPANLGYSGFPKTICTSVNHVVCHGIPSEKQVLRDGDILNIDVAIIKDGWYGDTSRMYAVGTLSPEASRLVQAAYDAMRDGILQVKPGNTLGDVGHAIQKAANAQGFSVVREYCGHGVGQVYHDEPQVLNYGQPGKGLRLKPGMIFTVEPMVNAGKAGTRTLQDGWTVVTQDKGWSAQWEHMVVVTDEGFELLTEWPDGMGSYQEIAPGG